MWTPLRSPVVRYVLPFGAIIAALLFQGLLTLIIPKGADFPYALFYLLAILGVAWYGGYGPGVIASLVTVVGIPLAVSHGAAHIDPVRVILLVGAALLVAKISRDQQRLREILATANENLEQSVAARTHDLAEAVTALKTEVTERQTTQEALQTQLGRLNLLQQITRLIAERQDLRSVFQVVIRTLEDSLPLDFGCVCLYEPLGPTLIVTCVGVNSEALAMDLALNEQARVSVDRVWLQPCLDGQLLFEPNVSAIDSPFLSRLADGGMRSVVFAPLMTEKSLFALLIVARRHAYDFSGGEREFLGQLSEHVGLAARQADVHAALQRAYDDLRRTQQAVMEHDRLRALGQMASGIAHDINNALSPVSSYTDLLLESETDLTPRTRKYLETMQRAVEDVSNTVGRMREFYRQPELQAQLRAVDLNKLVGQVLDLTRPRWSDMLQRRGVVIRVITDLASDLPAIAGLENEIREALTNLIFNAVDAMPHGGSITLRTAMAKSPSTVCVAVEDTGVGMDEATRHRCLEPFFTTKGERGTGLGLAMVYGMTQRHNALLQVESTPGKGTTMSLEFPVPARPAAQATPAPRKPASSAPLDVLVVDDDPLVLRCLRDILETDNHLVTAAAGGQEGIDIIQDRARRGQPFSVVITDLGMPYVDGRKVASAVKMAWNAVPVILLTGWGQRIVDDNEVPVSVDRVLNKPIGLAQLRGALADLSKETPAAIGQSM